MPPPPRPALRPVADRTDEPAPPLPPEVVPPAPDLLAALEAGDDAAVWAWVRAHTPETESLLLYGLLLGAGVVGLLEWPAVLLSAAGQLVIDRRFGGVEKVAADLRRRVDALRP